VDAIQCSGRVVPETRAHGLEERSKLANRTHGSVIHVFVGGIPRTRRLDRRMTVPTVDAVVGDVVHVLN